MNMLDKLARLESRLHRCQRALDQVAHVTMEFHPDSSDPRYVIDAITAILEDLGYDMGCTPSDPEDLIHGDSEEGAQG